MKLILFGVLFLGTAHSTLAHIGETASQIQTRYGAPSGAQVAPRKPATDAKAYRKNGIEIRVHYLDGRACLIVFSDIKPADRPELLKTLEDGRSWSGGVAYNASGPSPGIGYMRSDGIMARASGLSFEIFTKAWFDASEEVERNRIKGL